MGNDLPEPLTPVECDLRDFGFMPLDVRRLRDSEMAAIENPEAFRAAILAWCVAWHEVPAASLPDDDAFLARALGYGRDRAAWLAAREGGALRGFIQCSDGRLYHRVIAEKALEAWDRKLVARARSRRGNAARWGQAKGDNPSRIILNGSSKHPLRILEGCLEDRHGTGQGLLDASSKDPCLIAIDRDSRQGEGDSTRPASPDESVRKPSRKARPSAAGIDPAFETFWRAYPRRIAKAAAELAWSAVLRSGADPVAILEGLQRHRFAADPQFIPHAATWLNQRRWEDEPAREAPKLVQADQRVLVAGHEQTLVDFRDAPL